MDKELRENPHKFLSAEWYAWIHNNKLQIHEGFLSWTKTIKFESVLDVGCGKYDWYERKFKDKVYTGMDNFQEAINYHIKRHDHGSWIYQDIEKGDVLIKSDLVFSHSVIDHSPDPDLFIRKSIEAANKYAYIMSYRGWFPNIDEHKIEHGKDGYCYNDISVKQVRRLLNSLPCTYELKEFPTGLPEGEIQSELHIVVTKESAGNV